jgi:hypothetical protein
MPTRYANLKEAEDMFNAQGGGEADKELLFKKLVIATRLIEEFCGGRRFDQRVETLAHDGEAALDDRRLQLEDDLLTLTGLTNGDGTEIDPAGVTLFPYNTYPKDTIILPAGTSWSWGGDPYATVQVAGVWGFHRRVSSAWPPTGKDLPATLSESDTSITFAGDLGAIQRGHVLQIDDEQMSVEVIDGLVITVERGINGTEAVGHESGKTIQYYAPEPTIVQQTARAAFWLYKLRDMAMEKTITPMGEVVVPGGFPADIQRALERGGYVRRPNKPVYVI